jgi:hypothetical protein
MVDWVKGYIRDRLTALRYEHFDHSKLRDPRNLTAEEHEELQRLLLLGILQEIVNLLGLVAEMSQYRPEAQSKLG